MQKRIVTTENDYVDESYSHSQESLLARPFRFRAGSNFDFLIELWNFSSLDESL